jgi:hypothetical protein
MEIAFEGLKSRFISMAIVTHYNPWCPCIFETDALVFPLGVILSKCHNNGMLHRIAFYLRKFTSTEINYEIHNEELLAVVDSFKVWRRYLEGAVHMVMVFTDHQNLEYFTTTKASKHRKAR